MTRRLAPTNLALIGVGGAIGTLVRALITLAQPEAEPAALFAINIGGSFALGLLTAALVSVIPALSTPLQSFLGIGLLGGFTSYSALTLLTVTLAADSSLFLAAGYLAATVFAGIAAAALGLVIGNRLKRPGARLTQQGEPT